MDRGYRWNAEGASELGMFGQHSSTRPRGPRAGAAGSSFASVPSLVLAPGEARVSDRVAGVVLGCSIERGWRITILYREQAHRSDHDISTVRHILLRLAGLVVRKFRPRRDFVIELVTN